MNNMKMLHVMLGSFYIDNMSYQENLLPKYHKKLGYDVEIVASNIVLDGNGNSVIYNGKSNYLNKDGIQVRRLPFSDMMFSKILRKYSGLKKVLEQCSPDIIFVHNLQFLDIRIIAQYCKKKKNVRLYIDNHADFSNSANNWISKRILHGIIWKTCAKTIMPYVEKFYGVLPARVDFLHEMYGIPKDRIKLLVMGADDELISQVEKKEQIEVIRKENGVLEDDLLIVTGGKINRYRPEVLNLMKAIIALNNRKIKLLVFGTPSSDLKDEFFELCKNNRIIYVGWVSSVRTYEYMAASDLVFFPGLHSVMWEQAVAIGKPCIFRDIEGFHHVNLGGNCEFINDVSIDGILKSLDNILSDKNRLSIMEKVAKEKGKKKFTYSKIAEESLK